MVCWWVGPRGAISGAIAGAVLAGTISMGSQAAAAKGLRAPPLNLTFECAINSSYVAPFTQLVSFDNTVLAILVDFKRTFDFIGSKQ